MMFSRVGTPGRPLTRTSLSRTLHGLAIRLPIPRSAAGSAYSGMPFNGGHRKECPKYIKVCSTTRCSVSSAHIILVRAIRFSAHGRCWFSPCTQQLWAPSAPYVLLGIELLGAHFLLRLLAKRHLTACIQGQHQYLNRAAMLRPHMVADVFGAVVALGCFLARP